MVSPVTTYTFIISVDAILLPCRNVGYIEKGIKLMAKRINDTAGTDPLLTSVLVDFIFHLSKREGQVL